MRDKKKKKEPMYPCAECGILRTKDEGGTTFTVCDECWDKHYKPKKKKCDCMIGLRYYQGKLYNVVLKSSNYRDIEKFKYCPKCRRRL